MRIAQIAPLFESVPPSMYGGTERVVSYLTEALVRQGHEVTLFASGDSVTAARLQAQCQFSLRLDSNCKDPVALHILMAEKAFQMAEQFDVLHFHVDYFPFPAARRKKVNLINTLHGRLDRNELVLIYDEFDEMPVVSVSNAQRRPLPDLNWMGTVYHGIPLDLYQPNEKHGAYLALIGRISPEKGLDVAIRIAIRSGMPLKIAAKVDAADQDYFKTVIKPLLKHPQVEFVGEIKQCEKNKFLGEAYALLFPIDWPEPFGLAMIEAMACGTPVIARSCGSVPEVVDHGITGFICRTVQEAVRNVPRVRSLDRALCRRAFEQRFSAERMAADYLALYQSINRSWAGFERFDPRMVKNGSALRYH